MPTPYTPEELSIALVDAARRSGLPLGRLSVAADEAAGVWTVHARAPGGEERRLTFPFASARGIYTPADIADHLTRGTWPFG